MYATTGRPSIPPEKLLRAQLLRMLYSIRSGRLLMEEIDYVYYFRAAKALESIWGQSAGAGAQTLTRGKSVHVPAESTLTFRLEQPLTTR